LCHLAGGATILGRVGDWRVAFLERFIMRLTYLIVVAALSMVPTIGFAQAIPGFGGGSLFEPEIDVVNSGVILDTQATVSADRKYVTMTFRTSNTQLLALRSFTFQSGGPAVGIIGGGGGAGGIGGGAVSPQSLAQPSAGGVNAPVRIARGAGPVIMNQRGITPIVRN